MNQRSPLQPRLPTPPPEPSEKELVLDFGKIFAVLRSGWWIIAGMGLAGAMIAAILVLQVEPTYRSTAQLLMGQKSRPGSALGTLIQDLNLDDDAIAGEIAIITSGRILSKVSARLDLASRPEFNAALNPPEPEASWPVRLADRAVDSLKSIMGRDVSTAPTPDQDAAPDPISTAAQIGKVSLGDQVDYVGELMRNLQVRQVGNTNLVDVRFASTDRLLAAAVPNTVVDVYLEDQLDRKFLALRRMTKGLDVQLSNMRQRLEASERELIEYRNQDLAEGFGGQERLTQQLADLSRRLSQVSAEHAELAADLAGIDALIEEQGMIAAAGLFESAHIESMQDRISDLRQRLDMLQAQFVDQSSQVDNVVDEIGRLETALATQVRRLRDDQANRVDLAAARVQALRGQLKTLETHAIQQSERDVRMSQLERDHAAQLAVYATFLDKFTQTSEAANLQEGDAQVISYADPPPSPIAPDKKLAVALGGIAGAFGGIGLIFLRTLTDTRVRTTSRLHSLMRGTNVFALPMTRRFLPGRANPLAAAIQDPLSPLSESIRSLRSHLILSETGDLGRVVTFVSTRSDCGKTTASLLLARSMAQMGISCVVVDADLRRTSIANLLGLPSEPGLMDVLKGTVPLEQALSDDPESQARILTSRSDYKDPAGILLSAPMNRLIEELRQKYRWVIIDTAPLLAVSDAAPMARLADNVVLMVRYGLPAHEVEAGLDILRRIGVDQISAVLSMSPYGAAKAGEYSY